jgi:DNA-3-methyladenine glycosylase II
MENSLTNSTKTALNHFKKSDNILYEVWSKTNQLEPNWLQVTIRQPEMYFSDLCETIVGQQLSNKVADVIWQRFLGLFETQQPDPTTVLLLSEESMRTIGLSRAKTMYVKNIAQNVIDKKLILDTFQSLDEATITSQLVQVKGVGPWTAEMFMMFTLGKPDIFSFGDLGLKKGIEKWYGELSKEELQSLTLKWSPFRTYAAKILWKSLTLDS